jgi:hypothetical protein
MVKKEDFRPRQIVAIADKQTAPDREEAARKQAADLRQETADPREDAAIVKVTTAASAQAQLREVNERLIIATIHAQKMTKAARLATEQMSHMAQHDFLTGRPDRPSHYACSSFALSERHLLIAV